MSGAYCNVLRGTNNNNNKYYNSNNNNLQPSSARHHLYSKDLRDSVDEIYDTYVTISVSARSKGHHLRFVSMVLLFVIGRRGQQKLPRHIFAHSANLPEQTAPFKYASKDYHPCTEQVQAKCLPSRQNGKAEKQEIHQQL